MRYIASAIIFTGLIGIILLAVDIEVERDWSVASNILFPFPFETEYDSDQTETTLVNYRLNWENRIHSSETDKNWRNIERANKEVLRRNREKIKASVNHRVTDEHIGGGRLIGNWNEIGSTSLAGSVIATSYDELNQNIYLVSAGGSLFKGKLFGDKEVKWSVLDDDQRYDGYFLQCLYSTNGSLRLFAAPNGIPHFTDNHGSTWKRSKGIPRILSTERYIFDFVKTMNNQLYLIAKSNTADLTYKVYHSTDLGENFRSIYTFYADGDQDFKLTVPHNSNSPIFILRDASSTSIYKINSNQIQQLFSPTLPFFKDTRVNITGSHVLGKTTLYCYTIKNNYPPKVSIQKSENGGYNWKEVSEFDHIPFTVGLYVLPNNPNIILLGGVECFISNDGGESFIRKNKWIDYYKSPMDMLHADMMYFNFIQNNEEKPFLLISNHGGLYISYDNLKTVSNIGTNNLNVSQYYSVKTNPDLDHYTFVGSQDQGIQRAKKVNGKFHFEQLLSGDFGNILFSNNNQRMWSIGPGGTVFYWHDFINKKQPSHYILTDADERKVWIPQIINSYNDHENAIFVARNDGKNAEIDYSHIKKISFSDVSKGRLYSTPYPFNFSKESNGGELTTFNYHPIRHHEWIAGTSNGCIFYSDDYWRSFKKSNFAEDVDIDHFYIHKVYFSPNSEKVFVVGSGYSNSPIIVSNDGGRNFTSMQYNLPPTTIFDIKIIDDLIFIATENGPWVFFQDLNKWFTMTGFEGPLQSYRAIDYIEDQGKRIVRFGTFGRGIWDFNIDRINAQRTLKKTQKIRAFPNPCSNEVSFELPSDFKNIKATIYKIDGSLIKRNQSLKNAKLDITHLKKGSYIIHLSNKELNFVSKLIKN